jgi:hypothetical protein
MTQHAWAAGYTAISQLFAEMDAELGHLRAICSEYFDLIQEMKAQIREAANLRAERDDARTYCTIRAGRIETMGAALRQIAAMQPWVGSHPDYGQGHDAAREAAREIAQAALDSPHADVLP